MELYYPSNPAFCGYQKGRGWLVEFNIIMLGESGLGRSWGLGRHCAKPYDILEFCSYLI